MILHVNDYTLQDGRKSIHIAVFTGGESPAPERTEAYWRNAGAPDSVIAADSGLDTLRAYSAFFAGRYDFAPRRIAGDFDSLRDKSVLSEYPPEIIAPFPADKDDTDTELAVRMAYEAAEKAGARNPVITLVGGGGGRVDHFMSILDSFASDRHATAWLCGEQAVYFLAAPGRCEIGGLSPSDCVSVARTAAARTGGRMESRGLVWNADVFRKEGMPSVSNRISGAYYRSGRPVELTAEGADLLVIVPLHARVRTVGVLG